MILAFAPILAPQFTKAAAAAVRFGSFSRLRGASNAGNENATRCERQRNNFEKKKLDAFEKQKVREGEVVDEFSKI